MIDYRYAKLDTYLEKFMGLLFKTKFRQLSDLESIFNKLSDELVRCVVKSPQIARKYIIDKKDYYYLPYHSVNTAIYSISAAYAAGKKMEELRDLAKGALLHDAGMVKVPAKIFVSDKKLNAEELFLIQQHPEYGLDLIEMENSVVKKIILSHHEIYHGGGYPKGIPWKIGNDKLPTLVSIADGFDAMISFRVYKKTISVDEAKLNILECSDGRWDRNSIENFLTGLKRLGI